MVCDAVAYNQAVQFLARSCWSIFEVIQQSTINFWDQTQKREVKHVPQKWPDGGAEAAKEVKEYKYDHGQYKYGVLMGSI